MDVGQEMNVARLMRSECGVSPSHRATASATSKRGVFLARELKLCHHNQHLHEGRHLHEVTSTKREAGGRRRDLPQAAAWANFESSAIISMPFENCIRPLHIGTQKRTLKWALSLKFMYPAL